MDSIITFITVALFVALGFYFTLQTIMIATFAIVAKKACNATFNLIFASVSWGIVVAYIVMRQG